MGWVRQKGVVFPIRSFFGPVWKSRPFERPKLKPCITYTKEKNLLLAHSGGVWTPWLSGAWRVASDGGAGLHGLSHPESLTLPPLIPRTKGRYLVDSASSHMLVSKTKPCMSKYKQLYCETANGSLNQL